MTDATEWDDNDGGDWKGKIAALVGMTGAQYRNAIVQICGSTLPGVEWRRALVDKIGTGHDPVDWTIALTEHALAHGLTTEPDEDWQLVIVPVLTYIYTH
jgi:hypothetical protein